MDKDNERIKENKRLISKFPFLALKNGGNEKSDEEIDYEFTELDALPKGWKIAFGEKICEELTEALGALVKEYKISQIKEKWGGLRWYDFGNTEKGFKVIDKYEKISRETCIVCGEKGENISGLPLCEEHQRKI